MLLITVISIWNWDCATGNSWAEDIIAVGAERPPYPFSPLFLLPRKKDQQPDGATRPIFLPLHKPNVHVLGNQSAPGYDRLTNQYHRYYSVTYHNYASLAQEKNKPWYIVGC